MATITIEPNGKRMRVMWQGHIVADSSAVLDLKEGSYPVVHYVPRADADMTFLLRSDKHTRCPFKGEASYFSLVDDASRAEDGVWTYEQPLAAVSAIAGHLAFYPDKVTFEHVDEGH